ncbi:hypothetical protein [Grimontia sp. NTOU-MAR1]|uniref:hypothetical protein n=1 Tax=Grimontia sp. NTOU-MAR1 TaxID=3111011 RepID=UPI002DB80F25|nr:hypothetical protein [Grimontia sp. NTOU-MAR1]WRV99696.1 hypothetical protein VP504_22165 [Grimontia sp. NTOU-MAR1]
MKCKTGDIATAACAVSLNVNGDVCSDVRIALTNLGPTAFRARKAEWVLEGHYPTPERLNAAVQIAMQSSEPAADQRGNEEYKTAMAGEMLHRALQDAITRR